MSLVERVQQGESEALEFKRSFDKESIETVCAFTIDDTQATLKNRISVKYWAMVN